MKVTFPHLGTLHIFCKAIAETAQIPYIVPPETSRKTLQGYECNECENQCEVIELLVDHQGVTCWGDLCEPYGHPQSHSLQIKKSGRQVARPAYSGIGGVNGHNMNDATLPGSPAVPVPSERDVRGASNLKS